MKVISALKVESILNWNTLLESNDVYLNSLLCEAYEVGFDFVFPPI